MSPRTREENRAIVRESKSKTYEWNDTSLVSKHRNKRDSFLDLIQDVGPIDSILIDLGTIDSEDEESDVPLLVGSFWPWAPSYFISYSRCVLSSWC